MREGWREVTLGELSPGDGLQTGPFGSQLKASEYTTWGVPVVMPKDMTEGRILAADAARVPEEVADRLAKHRVRPGDILFGRRGELGRCGLVTHEQSGWLCGTGCLRFRPTSDISPDFLIQLLGTKTTASWLEENAVGQTMLNLNTEILGRLPIVLPPLPEQRKIAAILSSVDEAIEKSSAVIDQLEVVKKALMQDLLPRGLPGRHKRFKQTTIGEIPEGWEVSPLSSVASVFDPNPSHRYPTKVPTGIPLASTENFSGGDLFDLSSCPRIDQQAFSDQKERCNYESNDVVFARKGRIGFARPYGTEAKAFSHTVVTLKASRSHFSPGFLLWVVRSSLFLGQLQKTMNSNSGVPTLGVKIIASTFVPIPPLFEQQEISSVLDSVSTRATIEDEKLVSLRSLKAALLSALLTGRQRVPLEQEAA